MGQWEIEQYHKKYQDYIEADDKAVKDVLVEELNKLWYYYLTPRDKKMITEASVEETNQEDE